MPETPTPSTPRSPQTSLADLKKRLNKAQEIVVSPDGQIHDPDDPQIAGAAPQGKTVLKPQRWFSRWS